MGLLEDLKGYDQLLDADDVPQNRRHTLKVIGAEFGEEVVEGVLVTTMTVDGGGGAGLSVQQDGEEEGTGIDTLDFVGLDVNVTAGTATVAVRGPAEYAILDAGGDWINFDLEAACPGIKPGDIVAIQTIDDLTIHSIIPPSGFGGGFRCTLCFRNQSGGNWLVTVLDGASPDLDPGVTPGTTFRTPGAQFNEGIGPDYQVQSEEDAFEIAFRETGLTWFIIAGTAAQRGAAGSGTYTPIPKFDNTHSPVARYDFEDNLLDSSGNGFDLTGASHVFREVFPGLIALAGGSASRAANDALLTILGDVTVQAIVSFAPSSAAGDVMKFANDAGADGTIANNTLYRLIIDQTGTNGMSAFHENAGGANVQFSSTGVANRGLPRNEVPFYVAMVRQSNVYTFYLNGLPYGTASGTLGAPTGGTAAFLVVRSDAASPDVAALKIIDSALSAAQIKAEYNRTRGVAFGPLP